jgi:tRNA pseudouridine38-40 synthase
LPNCLFKLTLAYDGTLFAGWQRQKNARTVQQTLEEALRKIVGRKVQVTGAGRTDSGVHAQGQVAHVKLRTRLSPKTLERALNAILPEDILIRSVQPAPSDFHARFAARWKRYRYSIWNSPERPLFNRNYALHVPTPLNLAAMRKAARLLQGRRDFRRFHSSGRPVRSTVRNLRRLTLSKKGPLIFIDAESDGFLYHMVRRIVGLLIEIGRSRDDLTPDHAPTAPAKGLCLIQVRYR